MGKKYSAGQEDDQQARVLLKDLANHTHIEHDSTRFAGSSHTVTTQEPK